MRGQRGFKRIVSLQPGLSRVDCYAALGQRTDHRAKCGILIFDKILDALDAGQLVFHRLRNLGLLEVDRDDRFLALGGEGEFLDDILRLGGAWRDGEQHDLAATDGADDLLAPHRGNVDSGLIDPHRDPGIAQPLHQPENPLPILRCITDKDFCTHGWAPEAGNDAEQGREIKGENLNQKFPASRLAKGWDEPRSPRSFL